MCGLLGFFTPTPSAEYATKLVELFDELEFRGRDATGVCIYRPWVEEPKKKWLIAKRAIKATEFIKTEMPALMKDIARSPLVLGHVRTKTMGTPKDPHNNHPVTGKHIILTHNGSVSTTDKVKSYEYKGIVDTEYIVALLESKGQAGLKDVCGTAGVVWVDVRDAVPTVYFWAHNQSFYVGKEDSGGFWWSTTRKGIETVCDPTEGFIPTMSYGECPEEILYSLKLEDDGVIKNSNLGALEGKKTKYTRPNQGTWNGSVYDYRGTGSYSGTPYARPASYGESSRTISRLETHHIEGIEEGVDETYLWNQRKERFELNLQHIKDKNIVPHLDEGDLIGMNYHHGWPEEVWSFDQHNWRVVNRAAGLQLMSLAVEVKAQLDETIGQHGG